MNEVITTIPSLCGHYQAVVIARPQGGFQVEVWRWTVEDVPDYGKVCEGWTPVREGLTLTDSVERAEELAMEKLRMYV
jgi:hypothetical protein